MNLEAARALRQAEVEQRQRAIAARVTTTPTPAPVRAEANLGPAEGAQPSLDPAIAAQARQRLAAERERLRRASEPRVRPPPGVD
jgi:hypothetical protein